MLKQGGDVRKPWIPRTPPLINTLAQSTRRHIPPATPPRPVGMPGVIRYAAFRYCCGSYVCSMRSLSYVCSIPLREVAIPPPPLPFEQVYVEQVFESATLPLLEQVFEYDTQRIESPSVLVWVGTCVRVTVCYLCSLYPVSDFFRTCVRCSVFGVGVCFRRFRRPDSGIYGYTCSNRYPYPLYPRLVHMFAGLTIHLICA